MPVENRTSFIKPPALRPGDRIGLCCPAGRPENAAVVAQAQRVVTEMGFKPVLGANVMQTHGYMAGTDEQRLGDLAGFLQDESVAGIFCLTGGFGSLHLLPFLDYAAIGKAPKVVMGCDDNTALLNALLQRAGIITLHGPNIDQLKSRTTFARIKSALTTQQALAPLSALAEDIFTDAADKFYCPQPGTATGRLIGGNLTALVSLLGTPYEPAIADAILFLEDINELNSVLDRWFTTLYLSGHLQKAQAVAFGSFENCNTRDSQNMLSVLDTFSDRLKFISKIACFGLPFGQTKETNVIPLGVKSKLDSEKGTLEFLEPALS